MESKIIQGQFDHIDIERGMARLTETICHKRHVCHGPVFARA
jgi:hypothetical protein